MVVELPCGENNEGERERSWGVSPDLPRGGIFRAWIRLSFPPLNANPAKRTGKAGTHPTDRFLLVPITGDFSYMDSLVPHSGSVRQTSNRKFSSSISQKDLWFICKQGSVVELDLALLSLKKNGGNIDARNAFGLTPLHIATWRNHVPIVKRLLAAGADPDSRDGESGWSSLHRALHFGHLAVASVLLQAGASLTLEDSKCRTPVDLLSGPVFLATGNASDSVATEVFSWGSGTNYQLGTGNAHIQKLPCKVDALQSSYIKIIAASKFHSVAVGSDGQLYTWGYGRGGRLGHPDFDVHSGQAAVITPRQVILGLGTRRVKIVAAAKHHTVIATESGEVFTWGSNREGQLGYTSVDTQPTPRRVSSLKVKVIAVAAGNKHSAAVAESGEVFTWGCNKEGQLGYGTSNSVSNSIPRMVEYLKGKVFRGVSAAKYHTIVLGPDGEVFTWGHRLVTPKRVVISRNIKKSGNTSLKFHRMERLHVISVAAGVVHSTALTDDGALFYWVSSDPELRCQQLYSLCGTNIVSISAGKYWTAAVTTTGDVYMWDGKKYKDGTPIPVRLHGIKRATSVCVGETHLLALCALYHPSYPLRSEASVVKQLSDVNAEVEELDYDNSVSDIEIDTTPKTIKNDAGSKDIPSLKSLCEKAAAELLVEPRNAIQILEIADSLEADNLRKYCEELAIHNLDYIFTVSASAIASASPEVLAKLEKLLDTRSSEPWSYRRLPTPTATFPVIINSDEDIQKGHFRLRDNSDNVLTKQESSRIDCFVQTDLITDQTVFKQVRALKKKLQQIEILVAKQLNGHHLDDQQIAKIQTRSSLECALAELGFPLETESTLLSSGLSDGKGNKKAEISRKQRRKPKQKATQSEVLSINSEIFEEQNSVNSFPDIKTLEVPENMEDIAVDVDAISRSITMEDSSSKSQTAISLSHTYRTSHLTTSKKKNRKGGLSMFLSGALDDAPAPRHAPLPIPKNEGPAWGGAKFTHNSLRDIQNEQSKTKEIIPTRSKGRCEDPTDPANSGKVRLGSFLSNISSPIVIVPAQGAAGPDGEKSTPPWSSSGTSPGLNRPSLRDIQLQQEKRHVNISHSPKTKISGFSVSSTGSPSEAGGPKDSVPNRWFKPETDAPSSIRSIQIEERAMKDLKRFYSSVKLVKPHH
ncbi:Regulator of chromosome condensation (RCC1) repeat [Musa troglodytarum]|uniref:Regulator of chromosome condensation (RCC1) repeat n=1 Tax=Musa troglodytarum TaxID=320322 RepID=A0A9E7HTK4_9LILI|nr:Regulator of chromosome condensation (RCC1) repeat [Musa troglodytarum]